MKSYFILFIYTILLSCIACIELYPKDIGVVIGVGDSVTAATHTGTGLHIDSPQYSFSTGGNKNSSSIVKYVKRKNPNVLEDKATYTDDGLFNVAIAGSITSNLTWQLDNAIDRLKSKLGSDYDKTWKLFTILSGGNDICSLQESNKARKSAKVMIKGIETAIDKIRDEIPNSYINLLGILDPSQVYDVVTKDQMCATISQFTLSISCPIAQSPNGRSLMKRTVKEANKLLVEMIEKYESNDSFLFSYHPITENFMLKSTKYLSSVDCYHPNKHAHSKMANALWKSMFTPKSERKPEQWKNWKNIKKYDEGDQHFVI